jgi:ABC-2 type transport system ATP-binding protein
MHLGRLVAQAPLAELRAGAVPRVRVETSRPADAARILRELGLSAVDGTENRVTAILGAAAPEKILADLVEQGVPVRGFAVVAPDLEEMFVSLTGEGFDVSG